MSFEFEKPTCFSPNGLVFGSLREGHAYSAPCRSYAGGPFDNRIIWYFVSDDAPLYEGINAFEPRVDNIYDVSHDTLEKCALRPCPRKHTSGLDIWFRDASGIIGDEDDFAGRGYADKYLFALSVSQPPCIIGPHLTSILKLGNKVRKRPTVRYKEGLALGAAFESAVASHASGLRLGSLLTTTLPPPPTHKQGLALGVVGESRPAVVESCGLALGGVCTSSPPVPIQLAAGLRLAMTNGSIETPVVRHCAGGLWLYQSEFIYPNQSIPHENGFRLGMKDRLTPPNPLDLRGGLRFGLKIRIQPRGYFARRGGLKFGDVHSGGGTYSLAIELAGGLKLGIVGEGSGSGVSPGEGCAGAAEIVLGAEYEYDKHSGLEHTFRFDAVAGHSYEVVFIEANEFMTTCRGESGDSCDDLDLDFFVGPPIGGGVITPDVDGFGLVSIDGGGMGVGHYKFVVNEI